MRTLCVFVVGLLALMAGGCGGESAEEEVRTAWESASHAIADGNATEFCALLGPEGTREIARQTGGLECESAVRLLASQLDARDKDAIRGTEITRIDVRGDAATVTYETSGALAKVGFTGHTSMGRVAGRWLLSGV